MLDLTSWFNPQDVEVDPNVAITVVIIVALLTYFITSNYLLWVIGKMAQRTKTEIDDIIIKHKVLKRLSLLAPVVVIYTFAVLFDDYQADVERAMIVCIAGTVIYAMGAFLNAAEEILRGLKVTENIPLHNYVHLARIFIYLVGTISIWTGKSPGLLLTGIGALMAVVLLIFKDTILSLVASVQISTKDLLREGDWLEMPAYGADGDVVEISLHTVRVRNWDKTFTAIPTYKLLDESFKNWRGMQESGGRRIKRALHVDVSSIRFLTQEMVKRFRKYQLITDYIDGKLDEVEAYNREHQYDTDQLINGRRLTNLGTYRAYIVAYLKNNPSVHKDMTFLVRQLEPTPEGVPIQIYIFTTTVVWTEYEAIQSDIFDHLLAVAPLFDLKLYQHPAGSDFQKLGPASAPGPSDASVASGVTDTIDPELKRELEAGAASRPS